MSAGCRIPAVQDHEATPCCQAVFNQWLEEEGLVPNLVRVMAHSPAVVHAYTAWNEKLNRYGALDETMRRRIALAVADVLGARYCSAANMAMGRAAGLSEAELMDACRGQSPSTEVDAVLSFVRTLVSGGRIDDCHMRRLERAGYNHGMILEVVAYVSTCFFHACVDRVARIPVDYPEGKPCGGRR